MDPEILEKLFHTQRIVTNLTRTPGLDQLVRATQDAQRLQQRVAQSVAQLTRLPSLNPQIEALLETATLANIRFESAATQISRNALQVHNMLNAASPALRSAIHAYEMLASPDTVLGVDNSLIRAMEALRKVSEGTETELRHFLDHFNNGISKALEDAPEEPHLRLSWYGYILSILLFILGIIHSERQEHLSSQSTAELESAIMEQFQILSDRFDALETSAKQSSQSHEFYLVERRCPLTTRPYPKAPSLRWLDQGEAVWIIARKGRWARIHYIDSIEGSVHDGWVRKKYLKR